MIAELTGFRGETHWDTSKPDGQIRRVLDVQRGRRVGFEAAVSLYDGLAETLEWYRRSTIDRE